MATTQTVHAQLIRYATNGDQIIVNLKSAGSDISIDRSSNTKLPTTVTSAQALANSLGTLAFKDSLGKGDVGLGNVDNTADADKSVKYATTAGSANAVTWGNVSGKPSTYPPSSHTHNYAGSSSAGGAAASAVKLATARTINGVSFDGSANISLTANPTPNELVAKNLNDVTTPGFYFSGGSNTCTNKPSNVDAFGLIVFKSAAGYITQILMEGNTSMNKTWFRQYNASAWSAWGYYYNTSFKPSKSDVGLGSVDNTADANKSVKYATSAGSATNATKDSADQQINTTYIKGISISGRTVTITKGDGTTSTQTTQDTNTVYTHPNSGVTAGTYRSVTVNAAGHVTAGTNPTTLSGYGITDAAAKSHTHTASQITDSIPASKISGVLSIDNIPQGALERVYVAADDAARLKLTTDNVQNGDVVKVTSTGKMYFVIDQTKLTSEDGYMVFAAGTAASVAWSNVTGKPSTFTPASHTHNYAGSGSAGGSANSAVKLDTATAGSATQPVYFSGGKPVATTYTLGKSVPSNAVFTDTTYSTMTAATASAAGNGGLVPAPAAGKQGQFLRGDGTWATPTNTTYSVFKGATSSAAGSSGLVPAPATGNVGQFLRGDGTWATPTDTKYTHPSATAYASGLYKITTNNLGHVTAATAVTKADITALGIPGSDTNTDTKVTQTAVSNSTYTNWRTILWGASNNATEGFTPTTVTDGVYSDPNLTYQPSSGTLKAKVFKGSLSGNASTASKLATTASITGGNGNTAGYRLIASHSLAAWSNYRATFIVNSRHEGAGILSVAFGCNAETVSQANAYGEIRYFGLTSSGSVIATDSFQIYISADGATAYLFEKYWDYSTLSITQLAGDFSVSNGTWVESISSTTYGALKASTQINEASSVAWGNVTGKPSSYPPSSHTHSYAGSGSAGGSANSAVKLDTATAGSATQPVYFSGGKPVACSYTLGKSVPSNAVFTDTTYSVATSSANGLMPSSDKAKLDFGDIVYVSKDTPTRACIWVKLD